MNSPAPLLALRGVVKVLGGRRILDALDWELNPGQCAVILGPSGAGKSVFLSTLLGFHLPDSGQVERPGLQGTDIFQDVAVVFQDDALIEDRSIEANLAIAREERFDRFHAPFADDTESAIERVLSEVGLIPAQVRKALPAALSGGMRRRVALARALIREPKVLIADEPTSGLDPASSLQVYDLIASLLPKHAMSAIVISHDPHCASRLGAPVYYFSPVAGSLPRWDGAGETDPAARHAALLRWMQERAQEHAARSDHSAQPAPPAVDPALHPLAAMLHPSIAAVGRLSLLAAKLRKPPAVDLFARDFLRWGVGTLPLALVIFAMLGVVMEVQAEAAVLDYGVSNKLPELVALSLLRLAPILTGFLVAGRCGSAIAARVGGMQLGGQFRGLRTLRIDPDHALLAPLLPALMLATPLLALAGVLVGACGAALVLGSPLSQARITIEYFAAAFPAFLSLNEICQVILKGAFMGGGIALIAHLHGSLPKRSPEDVGRAITRGLVAAFIWCAVVDSFISLMVGG